MFSFFYFPAHLLDLFVILGPSGDSWSHGNDGVQGRDGKWFYDFYASSIPFIHIVCQYRVNHINICLLKCLSFNLWQGARGPDGEPGPQGVAGATVSLSNNVDVIVFATNAGCTVWVSWLFALLQGDQGQRGVMGEPGPKGETVSRHTLRWTHWFVGFSFYFFNICFKNVSLLCHSGYSRTKRNHRSSRSQGRGCECLVNNDKQNFKVQIHCPEKSHSSFPFVPPGLTGCWWSWGYSWDARSKGIASILHFHVTVSVCHKHWGIAVSSRIIFTDCFPPQGEIGKSGAPGEVGLQGLPVSMTFDLQTVQTESDWMHLIKLLWSSLKHHNTLNKQHSKSFYCKSYFLKVQKIEVDLFYLH